MLNEYQTWTAHDIIAEVGPGPYEATNSFRWTAMNNEMTGKSQMELSEDLDPPDGADVTELVASSPVLARLVEEVRNEQVTEHIAYNRMHNRHNRSR